MEVVEAPALWAFEDDIKNRSWWDWIKAHTSGVGPLHRYSGKIALSSSHLFFQGIDSKTNQPFEFKIYRNEIVQMYIGFDDTFSAAETRDMGLFWEPLRIKFIRVAIEVTLYLIVNYKGVSSDDKQWFDLLKNWLS